MTEEQRSTDDVPTESHTPPATPRGSAGTDPGQRSITDYSDDGTAGTGGRTDGGEPLSSFVKSLVDRIGPGTFEEWDRERRFAENIRSGQPWWNTPPPVKDPDRHNPHQLNQCHRKQLSPPEERRI